MGITWEVVVTGEMIAGKYGIGYLTWSSCVDGKYPQIIIGMISIGNAGYFSSSLIRLMSAKPGRVIKSMAIDLPRPRLPSVLTSTAYLQYKEVALDILHAEALKAFEGGSQAAADFVEAYEQREHEDGPTASR